MEINQHNHPVKRDGLIIPINQIFILIGKVGMHSNMIVSGKIFVDSLVQADNILVKNGVRVTDSIGTL